MLGFEEEVCQVEKDYGIFCSVYLLDVSSSSSSDIGTGGCCNGGCC